MVRFTRKNSICFLIISLLVIAFLGIANFYSSRLAHASLDSIYQQDDDVAINTEYVLEERFRPDVDSAIGFSGQRFLSDGQINAGHLFTSTVDGAKVVLGDYFGEVLGYGKDNVNGNKFSIVGMTVPNSAVGATEANIIFPFKTLKFFITDNADSSNKIIITFTATTVEGSVKGGGVIEITATYNDTVLRTSGDVSMLNNLYKASFRNRYYDWAGYPFNFEFDKDDAELNFYGLPKTKSVLKNLNYLEEAPLYSAESGNVQSFEIDNLTGFESYTVEMQFADYTYAPMDSNLERRASVVLFEMAGQVLNNSKTNVTDTTGPIVSNVAKDVVILRETDLSKLISVNDMVNGKIETVGTLEGTFSIKVDGVSCPTGKYTFTEEKDYSIEYTIYDTYKKSTTITSVKKTITVSGIRDKKPPVISWDKNYKASYYANTYLAINDINISDDYDENPMINVTAYLKNGDEWQEVSILDNVLKLSTTGEYKVKYTVTDFSGNSSSIDDTFTVNQLAVNLPETIEEDYVSQMYYMPQPSLSEELSYYIEKFDISDTGFANGERITTRAIMFAEPCSFVLRYSIFSGNESNVIAVKVVKVVLNDVENESQEPGNNNPQDGNGSDDSSSGCSGNISFTKSGIILELSAVGILFGVMKLIRRRKNGKA